MKLVTLLCIVAISTVGIVFAATRLMIASPASKAASVTDENTADMVTIYGNGVTFVEYERSVTVQNGSQDIQFYLPSGALTDTLTVSGISVDQIATSDDNHAILNSGDVITVYTQDGVYTGTFLSWDTTLVLEANNGTIMIPTTQITKIVLNEMVQVQGPNILVDVQTDSPPGDYEINVSYLMRGPTWTPTYFVDLNTSYLRCWATIENVESWSNVTLVLVSGGPHIVYNGPIVQPLEYGLVPASSVPLVESTATTTDEYHEYTYNSRVSFENGTTVRLPLFNGTVGLRQEYFWSDGDVENRYYLNDTLDEPLASGTVEFYRGDTWVGEDSIDYTPSNAESIEVVNYAYDIKVNSTVTKSIVQNGYEDQGITLAVTNYKSTSIQIMIQQDIDGYTLVSSTPPANRTGSTLSWTITLDPGNTTTIYYEWTYNS
jgi:hypothetical protein